jgi:hypothetical protein
VKELPMLSMSFGWLLAGALLVGVSWGNGTLPLASWIAAVCLLHFTRGMPLVAGALWLVLILWIAFAITSRDTLPMDGVAYGVVVLMTTIMFALLGSWRPPGVKLAPERS